MRFIIEVENVYTRTWDIEARDEEEAKKAAEELSSEGQRRHLDACRSPIKHIIGSTRISDGKVVSINVNEKPLP